MHTEHISDEELIELALKSRAESTREVASCPHCSDRLGEWQSFLGLTRSRLRSERSLDVTAARSLAESVLAQTTRQAAVSRSDLRLLVGNAPARSGRTLSWPWLAAAASLVALVGWAVFDQFVRSRELRPSSELELASAVLPAARTLEPSSGASSAGQSARDDAEAAHGSTREDARRQLDSAAAPAADGAPQTVVGRILGSRSAWLHERTPLEPREIAAAANVPAARALLCEHVLDRFALEEYIPEGFDRGIQSLLSASTANQAERRLELAALARARDYGLLDVAEERDFGAALAKAGVDPGADPLFAAGARTREPIDSAWLSALAASLGGAERCDPVVQAWLARR